MLFLSNGRGSSHKIALKDKVSMFIGWVLHFCCQSMYFSRLPELFNALSNWGVDLCINFAWERLVRTSRFRLTCITLIIANYSCLYKCRDFRHSTALGVTLNVYVTNARACMTRCRWCHPYTYLTLFCCRILQENGTHQWRSGNVKYIYYIKNDDTEIIKFV